MKQRTFKTLLFLFVIACFSSLLFVSASAAEETVGDFVFTVNGSSATLKEYKGSDSAVTIPSKVGTATVTTVGNEAFWSNKTMKSVSIPSTVKVIGTAAFNECTSLTKVVLPSKLTTLGNAAFWYCTGLKQVFVPKSATFIGENAFVGCHADLTVYVVKGSYGETAVSKMSGVNMAYRYITELKLSSASAKLQVGDTKALTYTYSPAKVYNSRVTYTSSDTSVATVDSKGNIKALKPGTAAITVTTKDGGKVSAKATITVVPEKVTGFKLTDVTPTGYTLNWDKSEGATKYRVYRYNSSTKKYETIKYTSAPSLTVTGMKVGSYQYYKVLAYTVSGGKYYLADNSSAYKAYVAKPQKVAAITAKPAHNYINLSWQAPENVNGYRIYLYNKETSKYTFLKATTKTSYKVTDLIPDTEYTFMVRAYLKLDGSTVYASYSPLKDCTTRPDYVTGIAVKEGAVFTTRLTLQWDKQEKASGYQIRQYNEDGSYETVATIDSGDINEYTLTELTPATRYGFAVRAFVTYDSGNLCGYFGSTPVYATTNTRPADESEAFKSFTEAFGTSIYSDESLVLIAISETGDFKGENSSEYESVVSSSQMQGTEYHYIVDGKDKATGNSTSFFIPGNGDGIDLSFEKAQNTVYEDDGNGYRISFTLSDHDAVTELFDYSGWDKIAAENEGFILDSYVFEKATVTAKVHNGYIDDITVTVPMTVSFTLGGVSYSFSQTYTQTYLFIR